MSTNLKLIYKRRERVADRVDELEAQLHLTMTLLKKWRKKLKYYDKAIEKVVVASTPKTTTRVLDL